MPTRFPGPGTSSDSSPLIVSWSRTVRTGRTLAFHSCGVMRRAHGLGLRRPALAQVDGEDRHRADGEELGLPVLQRGLPEIGRAEVAQPRERRLLVLEPLRVVLAPTRDGLREPGPDPERRHHEHERVPVDPLLGAAGLGPRRRVALGMTAQQLLLVGSAALLPRHIGGQQLNDQSIINITTTRSDKNHNDFTLKHKIQTFPTPNLYISPLQ